LALRCYFDLVCPYSYILGFEVERTEDDGLAEIEWSPFELRPAPKELPEPRGTYIRDHWRDHVYALAATHEVEIHVPRYQPRSTLALALHSFAEEEGRVRRTATPRTGHSL
jgi:predicted DsbA family dithiol-disulfide isomerase